MGDLFQPAHILVLLFVFGLFSIPEILFTLTLQGAANKCAPTSRTTEPGLVWLLIIPSLRIEFARRGIQSPEPAPAQSIGMTMAICGACWIIPIVNFLAAIVYFVLWIVYWVKISQYPGMLGPQVPSSAYPLA